MASNMTVTTCRAMRACDDSEVIASRRVALTGGPGAGKTTVLDLIQESLCQHVSVLPEAATIVFGGGFPRGTEHGLKTAAQRSIFYVQRELERAAIAASPAVMLCDRGTVDGLAYWSGPIGLWDSVGTSLKEQLERYDTVIHLRTPSEELGYNNRDNPLRIETADEARAIDDRIAEAWSAHPRRFVVPASLDFTIKATRAVELLLAEMPRSCRAHVVPAFERYRHRW